jgi:regulator of protease activity HflC (stomatin/prohibitin superfamily)
MIWSLNIVSFWFIYWSGPAKLNFRTFSKGRYLRMTGQQACCLFHCTANDFRVIPVPPVFAIVWVGEYFTALPKSRAAGYYFIQTRSAMLDSILIWAIISAILGVTVVRKAVIIVRQGYEFTLERFGRYQTTLRPGLHFIIPFINRVGQKVNMMERVLDVPSQEVISKDNAVMTVDGIVFFQVLDAAKAAYEVFRLEHAILNLTMTNIRTVLGSMDLDETLSQRDQINARLLSVVDEATTPWGLKVTRIEIKDISPPMDLVEAMARQMKAEREKRATILEAEGHRQSSILRAEGDKQAVMLDAEGRREAAFRDAEGRERLAEAEARATTVVSEAIASGDLQAINYFVAQKYIEALSDFATGTNTKTLLLPMEATGILSSLAGITEVAREAFAKRDDSQ